MNKSTTAPSRTETCCRICGGSQLRKILSLGATPLANSLLKDLSEIELNAEQLFPLELVTCPDCSLVQITETVDPKILFSTYLYCSSFADTTLENAKEVVTKLIKSRSLNSTSLAAEIASNDGYLLQYYLKEGINVLGIEPAQNIATMARQKGIKTIAQFFGKQLGAKLAKEGTRADVVHANNVLAHVSDLNGVVAGIYDFLKDDGVAVIEAPYLQPMLEHTMFDMIYHEHLCYFSLTALDKLFSKHNLFINDYEMISMHGGSLRIYVEKKEARSEATIALLKKEREEGVFEARYYQAFASKVEKLRVDLTALMHRLKEEDQARIAVYGASAKGSTLMNYFDIGDGLVDYVVDRSTVKQGRYTPGTHLPIYPTEKLVEDCPDYVVLLTWNLADEILKQQSEYRKKGGKFIIPIPSLKVV